MTCLKIGFLLAAAASLAIGTPAAAQDHSMMPGMKMPPPATKPAAKKKAPAKKAVTKKPAAKKTPPRKAPAKKSAARKPAPKEPVKVGPPASPAGARASQDKSSMPAGHDMSTMPNPPEASMPPAHDMSTMPGMTMPDPAVAAGTDLPAGNAPPPPPPTDNAADAVYGPRAMEMGRHHLRTYHGGQKFAQLLVNIAEYQVTNGRDGYQWDAEGWYGGDINRLWVKSEGEGAFGRSIEKVEVQALYSRAIDPYFNIQGGVRYDFKPDPSRVYATIGVEGLAPSFFDVEGAVFLSNKGELMARASGYYDQRITQRLILQPRAEFNFAAQNSRDIGVGAGLSDAELGLRLRYDIRREFAPYVGVQYSRAFGRTGRYLRQEGEDPDSLSLLAGIRFWF